MIAGLLLLLIESLLADRLRGPKQAHGKQPDPKPDALVGAEGA
jgi:hypothetical protein